MIKWKIKDEDKNNRNSFYFAKDGFIIKIAKPHKAILDSNKEFWTLEIYYYTNAQKTVVFNDNFTVKINNNSATYEANVKASASRLAKKLMGKYTSRANNFFTAIAS
jgi:uncharacterized protein YqkB